MLWKERATKGPTAGGEAFGGAGACVYGQGAPLLFVDCTNPGLPREHAAKPNEHVHGENDEVAGAASPPPNSPPRRPPGSRQYYALRGVRGQIRALGR
jgi:hypothetical protein